jgi:hypothetical protein
MDGERISQLFISNIQLPYNMNENKDDDLALNLLLDSLISNLRLL